MHKFKQHEKAKLVGLVINPNLLGLQKEVPYSLTTKGKLFSISSDPVIPKESRLSAEKTVCPRQTNTVLPSD